MFWAYHFLTGSLTHSLARTGRLDTLSGGLCRSNDLASVHQRLARYAAAGFRELHADSSATRRVRKKTQGHKTRDQAPAVARKKRRKQ
jgi:hypothetical protein